MPQSPITIRSNPLNRFRCHEDRSAHRHCLRSAVKSLGLPDRPGVRPFCMEPIRPSSNTPAASSEGGSNCHGNDRPSRDHCSTAQAFRLTMPRPPARGRSLSECEAAKPVPMDILGGDAGLSVGQDDSHRGPRSPNPSPPEPQSHCRGIMTPRTVHDRIGA